MAERPPPYDGPLPTGDDLERVRAEIKALRAKATAAKSTDEWWDNDPQRATALQIAVATADRRPEDCVAHSMRTGLPCGKRRILGGTVCATHGGSRPGVKKAARQRLRAELMPTLERIAQLRDQNDHLPTALAAAKTFVDRVLPVLRREQGSSGKALNSGPVINIGVALGGVEPKVQVTEGKPVKVLPPAGEDE